MNILFSFWEQNYCVLPPTIYYCTDYSLLVDVLKGQVGDTWMEIEVYVVDGYTPGLSRVAISVKTIIDGVQNTLP